MKTTLTILLATLALSSASTFLTTALEGGLNLAREFDVNVTHVENDLRKYAEAISDEDVRAFANKVLKAHGKLAQSSGPENCPGSFKFYQSWNGTVGAVTATVGSSGACASVDWAYCKGTKEYHTPWRYYDDNNNSVYFNPSKRGAPLWARRHWNKLGCNSAPGSGSGSASAGNTIIYDNTPQNQTCAYIYEYAGNFYNGSVHNYWCTHRMAQDCNGDKYVYYSYTSRSPSNNSFWTVDEHRAANNDFICNHRKSAGCPCKQSFVTEGEKWEKISQEGGAVSATPTACHFLYEWGGVYRPYTNPGYCNLTGKPYFYCNGFSFVTFGTNAKGVRAYNSYEALPSSAKELLTSRFGCPASKISPTCCHKELEEETPEYWYEDGTDTPWDSSEYAPDQASSVTDDLSWTRWEQNRGAYVTWRASGPDGSDVWISTQWSEDPEGRIPNDTDQEIQNKNDTADQYGNTTDHTAEGCIGKTENPLIEVATGLAKSALNTVLGAAKICHACKCKRCDDDEADKALKYNIFGCLSAVVQTIAEWANEYLKGWFSTWVDVFSGFISYTWKFFKFMRDHCSRATGAWWDKYKTSRDSDLTLGDEHDKMTTTVRDKVWDWVFDIVGATRDNIISGIKDFIISIIVDVAISAATMGAGAVVNGFKWGGKILIYLYYCGGSVKKVIEAVIQLVQEWVCTGCKRDGIKAVPQAPRCVLFHNAAAAILDLATCAAVDFYKWAKKCGCSTGRANKLVNATFGMSVWHAMGY